MFSAPVAPEPIRRNTNQYTANMISRKGKKLRITDSRTLGCSKV